MSRRAYVTAAVSGALMAIGLALGRLTRPEVIVGWVDFFGRWDPTMLIFFAFGVTTYHLMHRWALARASAGRGPALSGPSSRTIDVRLLIGAAIFGVGWAIGGVCPGPAFTSLGAGAGWTLMFVPAMLAGFLLVPRAFRA
jgi:uncharacterized protein